MVVNGSIEKPNEKMQIIIEVSGLSETFLDQSHLMQESGL